jgi:hypothetical protein
MDMQFVQPSAEIMDVAVAGLRHMAEHSSSRELRRHPVDQLRLTYPQQVYLLGLDDIRAGRNLESARPSGWRYLVQSPDGRAIAIAESVTDPRGGQVFAHLNYGPFVAGTAETLRVAERANLPSAEVRLLEVPALYLVALWLQHRDGATLIPIAPTPSGIEANRSYPTRELLDLLRKRARQLPDIDAQDGRGD